jgi:hypothetical protein
LPQLVTLAGTATPTVITAEATATGSTIGTFNASNPNSFAIVLGAGNYGDAVAGIFKTPQDLNPTNLFAQGSEQSSITGNVVFTITVPSHYSLSEQAAFSPYADDALSASDIVGSGTSSLSLYRLTANPGNVLFADTHTGTAGQFLIDQTSAGILTPGTYVLSAQTDVSQSFYINYGTGGNQGLFASVGASDIASLSVTPVPLPATVWLLLAGLAAMATFARSDRRHRAVHAAGLRR